MVSVSEVLTEVVVSEVVVLMGTVWVVLVVLGVESEVSMEVVGWEAGSKRVYDTIPSSLHPLLLPPSPLQLQLLLRGHVLVRWTATVWSVWSVLIG